MSRISLLSDAPWPNLVLMKLSALHKQKGDVVGLDLPNPDKVYISCIFTKNRGTILGKARFYESLGIPVVVGGSGVDLDLKLPPEIEVLQPDFDLYKIDYCIGCSSRGCFRGCAWCIVGKKEGTIVTEVGLDWVTKPWHAKIMLLDANFLASPNWKKKLEWFIDCKSVVSFNQGLDIRLVTEESAELLAQVNARDGKFHKKRLHFAFDDPKIEPIVVEKVKLLINRGIRPDTLFFYELVGYPDLPLVEADLHRFKVLTDLGCLVYIMRYHKKDPKLNNFARWVNGPQQWYRFTPFEQFVHGRMRGAELI